MNTNKIAMIDPCEDYEEPSSNINFNTELTKICKINLSHEIA